MTTAYKTRVAEGAREAKIKKIENDIELLIYAARHENHEVSMKLLADMEAAIDGITDAFLTAAFERDFGE